MSDYGVIIMLYILYYIEAEKEKIRVALFNAFYDAEDHTKIHTHTRRFREAIFVPIGEG